MDEISHCSHNIVANYQFCKTDFSKCLIITHYFCRKLLISVKNTLVQYDRAFDLCKDVFVKKAQDYGLSWTVLRPSSIADQMYIKAKRIRTIEELGVQSIPDGIEQEYVGLVNYGIMALIQLKHQLDESSGLSISQVVKWYEETRDEVRELMVMKNSDYGEAWRDMRISSFTDMILMKLLRVREIEQNDGRTIISEGLPANYSDMVNYAIFALIKLEESQNIR